MSIQLMALPFPSDALAPVISAETLSFHHGKHHQAYVDKVNATIAGTDLADASLETIITFARGTDAGLFNNAAQVWNHGFYWASLWPAAQRPGTVLGEAISRDFGSLEAFNDALAEKGAAHFGSGWVWLVVRDGKLVLTDTHDAETPVGTNDLPLLTIDVWEHAYYLDHQNLRPAYLKAVISDRLNWGFADANFERGTLWTYPA